MRMDCRFARRRCRRPPATARPSANAIHTSGYVTAQNSNYYTKLLRVYYTDTLIQNAEYCTDLMYYTEVLQTTLYW